MKKLKPIITEKSLSDSKEGKYSFLVDPGMNKQEIKKLINDTFGVNVKKVRTVNLIRRVTKTFTGKKKTIPARKKAVVVLAVKEKIDLFEEKKTK